MSGTGGGTAGSGAGEPEPEGAWSEWIRPEAAALGVVGVAAAALAHGLASPSEAPDGDDEDVAGPGGDDDDGTDAAWEQISRDTQQVADHGVTLMAMDGMAQAQADMIESFNPSNY
ncbi:MAG: hypothetical protein HY830_27135 [Actinobacteria bacterium]|nr:hypothetical protein [Actinomycetota bacterium]